MCFGCSRGLSSGRFGTSNWRSSSRREVSGKDQTTGAGLPRHLPGSRRAAPLRLRQRATPAAHRASPPRQVPARPHTQLPALPHREPRRVEYRAEHELPERSLLPLPRAALSELPARLPGNLRSLVPLHQPLLQRQATRLPVVPHRRHGHPQSPPRLIPRLDPIRLRPTLHQHPPPPPPPLTLHPIRLRPPLTLLLSSRRSLLPRSPHPAPQTSETSATGKPQDSFLRSDSSDSRLPSSSQVYLTPPTEAGHAETPSCPRSH